MKSRKWIDNEIPDHPKGRDLLEQNLVILLNCFGSGARPFRVGSFTPIL